ncbi:hypothetical protein EDD16DRAFT_1525034 [Pisolithus croceorrhizus]|nr:hypothetical protein EDD16DRAFT_1525034 [Pisolithus croceorrhizus]
MPVLKLRPIPAFYDGKPNLLPVLSSQVEIAFLPGRPCSESSPAPSKSSLSTLESEIGGNDKISKPSGEAGRPGHRGYNLEEQLGWGDDGFKSLKAVAEFPDLSTFKNYAPEIFVLKSLAGEENH